MGYREDQPWSTREYRLARAEVLAESNICGICGHPGATTCDHIIPLEHWPKDENGKLLPGYNHKSNLRPAHGTMGSKPPHNPCPICGKLCNQVKRGTIYQPSPHSREW